MPQEEEIDYHALKEQRARDREETRDLKNAFTLNIGNDADKFLAILSNQYRAPSLPGEPDRITRQQGNTPMSSPRTTMKTASTSMPAIPRYAAAPEPITRYAEIVDQLDRFNFSDDEAKRDKQIKVIAKAVRSAMQEIVLQEVANNTKVAFKDNAKEFFKQPSGLRVVFDFGSGPVSVTAIGGFQGDETICVHKANGKLAGAVVKLRDGEDYDDLSDQFSITVRA